MTLVIPTQNFEIIKGDHNLLAVDLNVDLDPTDEVWFTAKYSKSDLDSEAVITKQRSLGGIVDVEPTTGRCQVKVLPADTDDLVGRGLVYDVKVKKADVDTVQTAATGTIVMVESVNKDAA